MESGFQAGDVPEGAHVEPHPTAKSKEEEEPLSSSLQLVCNMLKKHLDNVQREKQMDAHDVMKS